MAGKRMCPNPDCGKHREPTGLMGGCDCGAKLVPFKTEDEETREALWEIASPTMKRLVTYAMLGCEFDRRHPAPTNPSTEEGDR